MIKKITSFIISFSLLFSFLPAFSSAQSVDPLTLPRFDYSGVVYKGSFTWDWPDGAGGDISYGGGAIGVSEDGKYLYISCSRDDSGIAKLEIPTLGGRAKVVAPCLGPKKADIAKVHPDPSAFRPMLGGVLEQAGRMVVTGYISYDASGGTTASHWGGPSLSSLTGPVAGTVSTGFVKSQMAPIPQEWRSVLGGSALSSAGYTSIISRASYGTSVSVFNPNDVGVVNPVPMKMLLGCPHSIPSCVTYGSPTSNEYNGSELSGGFFIVPNTRTLIAVERESSGPTCYGYGTTNPALHGQTYLDAVYCYSLSDPMDQKGPKGYPYRLVAKMYDLGDLVAVKNGTKNPWDVKQYATIDMPNSSANEFVTSGAFNPVKGEYYLLRGVGGGVNTVHVYGGYGASSAPVATTPTTPTNPTDTTLPSVSISSPSQGSTVSGSSVTVSASASDNVGVVGVQFKINGNNLGSEDTTAPYSVTWNTTTFSNASQSITAVARDSAGNTKTSSAVSVNVSNTVAPTISAPTVDIKANGSDSNIYIAIDTSATISWTSNNASSCSVSPNGWTGTSGSQSTGKLNDGKVYTVSCTGAGGTSSDSVTVIVLDNPTTPTPTPTTTTPILDTISPKVTITAPVPMTTTSGMPIFITADATDNVGVVGVQFQLDGVNFGAEDTTAPYSIIWDTKTTSIDDHNITAVARDSAGNKTTSSRVNVVVSDPLPATTTPTPVPTSTPVTTEPTTPTTTPTADVDPEPVVVGLKIGDKIKTTAWVNVRSTAGGRWIGSQRTGRTGTITAGPAYANELTWWKVNFTSGADGWVAEKFITKATVAMTEDDYRKNIANIYLLIKYLQERIAGQR